MTKRFSLVPPWERIGLARVEAAEFVGVSANYFDGLVRQGVMPRAKRIGAGRLVWDRRALERAFAELPDAEAGLSAASDATPSPYADQSL